MSFWDVINNLKNDSGEIHSLTLSDLSHLVPEQIDDFSKIWKLLSNNTKDKLLTELLISGDASIHFDFSSIFMIAINDLDDNISCIAISGLWEYEHRDLIKILVEKLLHHHSNNVRSSAAFALGRFATLAEENKLSIHDFNIIKNTLLSTIKNDSIPNDLKMRAFEAIAVFSTPDVDLLIRNMYYQNDFYFKKSAIFSMGRNGKFTWIPLILDELQNEFPEIQCEAIRACEEIGEERLVPSLISLLESDEIEIILAVIKALGQIGGELAKNALENYKDNYIIDFDNDNLLTNEILDSLESIEIMQFASNPNEL